MGHEPQTCEPSTPPGAAQAEPSDTSSACATAGDTAPSRSSPGLDLESKDADCLLRENLPAESLSGEGRKRRRQGLLDRLDAALRPPSESLFSGQRRDEHDDRTKGLGEKVKSGREYSPSGDHTPSGSQSGSRCRSGSPSERWQGLPLALDSALHERPVREVALTPGYEDFPFNNQIFECTTLGISLISALDSLPAFSTPLYSDEAALQEAEEKEEEAEEAVSALTRMESRQHKEETRDRNRYLVLQAFNDVMIDLNRRQSCLRPLERNRLFSTSIHIRVGHTHTHSHTSTHTHSDDTYTKHTHMYIHRHCCREQSHRTRYMTGAMYLSSVKT